MRVVVYSPPQNQPGASVQLTVSATTLAAWTSLRSALAALLLQLKVQFIIYVSIAIPVKLGALVISITGARSQPKRVVHGVLQGSVIGPTLFLAMMNSFIFY